MSKFKAGDKVRCVNDASSGGLTLGGIYTVTLALPTDDLYFVDVTKWGCGSRFELAAPAIETAAWTLLTIGQEVLVAIGINRNLKRATITNLSAGTDTQGNNLVAIRVDGLDVIVPENKVYQMIDF
jgi:hypothetical protein